MTECSILVSLVVLYGDSAALGFEGTFAPSETVRRVHHFGSSNISYQHQFSRWARNIT